MKTLPLLTVALCASTSILFAADPESPSAPAPVTGAARVFKNLDKDGDGGISLAEYKAGTVGQIDPSRVEDTFKKKDLDGNGKLNLEELKVIPPKPVAKPVKPAAATTEKTPKKAAN